MSKKSRLIVLCGAVLCSQYLCAQSRTMGIEEMFRLADENSKSIQTFRTGKEVADENLKAAKHSGCPTSARRFRAATGETESCGTVISATLPR